MNHKQDLQGAWKVCSALVSGEPEDDRIGSGIWFMEDTVVIGDEDAAWEYKYRLHGSTHPPRLEIWSDDANYPYRQQGVYDLRQDEFVLCYDVQKHNTWPSLVESTVSNGCAVLVYERSNKPVPE